MSLTDFVRSQSHDLLVQSTHDTLCAICTKAGSPFRHLRKAEFPFGPPSSG
jgi:hypothetical protein